MIIHNPLQADLFPQLDNETLEVLQGRGQLVSFATGEMLLEEDRSPYDMFILRSGQVRISKRLGKATLPLAVHKLHEFTGDISMLVRSKSNVSAQALEDIVAVRLSAKTVQQIICEDAVFSKVLLVALIERSRDAEAQLRQQEKLLAMSRLAAGLSHELLNPASALIRATSQIQTCVACLAGSDGFPASPKDAELCAALLTRLRTAAHDQKQAIALPFLSQDVEEEDALVEELVILGIEDPHLKAPVLAGFDVKASMLRGKPWDRGLVETLRLCADVGGLLQCASSVRRSSEKVMALVDAMKKYSYMDQAQQQDVDLHANIDAVLCIFKDRLEERGVSVRTSYTPKLPTLFAYAGELSVVWTNLFDNALEAMPTGGSLLISTGEEAEHIVVEVQDTGRGISSDHLNQVFEPFFTTKEIGEGFGLGLDIVRRIVIQHHAGAIHVQSHPGLTSFLIRLPIHGTPA